MKEVLFIAQGVEIMEYWDMDMGKIVINFKKY
jgi:hypothetical protein